jgi:hypothetical protein
MFLHRERCIPARAEYNPTRVSFPNCARLLRFPVMVTPRAANQETTLTESYGVSCVHCGHVLQGNLEGHAPSWPCAHC